MLVLSRKRNERICLGDGSITITVVEIRGDKVRLGITAPRELDVHREEIFKKIERAGPAAPPFAPGEPFAALRQCGLMPNCPPLLTNH